MADQIRRVDYYYVEVPDKAGEGVRVLGALKEAGVNLLSFTAFPAGKGKTQIDLVALDGEALTRAAKNAGLTLSARKQAFFVQGNDRAGAKRPAGTPTSRICELNQEIRRPGLTVMRFIVHESCA